MTGKSYHYRTTKVILVIIGVAVICYANAFRVPFLWDDEVLVLRNHYIRDFQQLGAIFATSHFQGGGEGGNFYRPLQIISYAFDYSIWQLNPFGYHLTNLIFHILTALLVYFLISRLSGQNLVGLVSALFFVVHPVHTEAVTYISGRADPQSSAFILLALVCLTMIPRLTCPRRYLFWSFAVLLYLCALLTKESALIFPFLALFWGLCFIKKKELKIWLPIYLSLFSISAIYILMRVMFLAFPKAQTLSLIAQAPPCLRLLTIPKVWWIYFALLVFPVYLHMERHFLLTNIASFHLWLGLALLFLTVWFLKLSYRRWRRGFFYAGWLVITLVPFLNLVPLNATMAEHWLYLPAVGFWALAAEAGVKFYQKTSARWKKVAVALSCFLFCFYGVRTVMRNAQWRDPLELYAHDQRYSEQSFLLHNNLGVELFRRGELEKAAEEFQAAVRISPYYATSRNNLGVVLENYGRLDEAIAEYRQAVELNNYILAYGNLGRSYLKNKQLDQAQAVLETGQQLYPQDVEIAYYLALTYFTQGRFSQAREQFARVAQLTPHYADTDAYLEKLSGLP